MRRWSRGWTRVFAGRGLALAGGLAMGAVMDKLWRDPTKMHPVAGFGHFASAVERKMYADSRKAGARFAVVTVGVPVVLATVAEVAVRRRPWLRGVLVGVTTWAVLGGASLRREATIMATVLGNGDLAAAHNRLSHLCGRDPCGLGEKELTRATVESVAENTSDAVVAPLVWGAIGGLPGLVGYRAVNTLDAMVGSRSPKYQRFGTAAARLDDAMNLLPSRLTAGLMVLAAPLVGGSSSRTYRIWLRDGAKHPSPNSGHCEAAAAGALDVRLGGRNVYAGRIDDRPYLGDGSSPAVSDMYRVVRLSSIVGVMATGLVTVGVLVRAYRRSRR